METKNQDTQMFTPKSRLHAILDGRGADRPACICPGGMMNMVTDGLQKEAGVGLPEAHTDPRKMADLAEAVIKDGIFENCGVPFCMTVEAEAMGAKVTLGNNLFEPHVVEYAMNDVDHYAELKPIDLESGRAKVVLDAIRILKDEVKDAPIIGNLTGPVSTAASLVDPEKFYMQLRKKNENAHKVMDFVTEQLIRFGTAQVEAGADVITIADPSGTGEILGPKYFSEFAVDYINQLTDALHKAGAEVIVHICGQMKYVYDQLKEVHSDALSFDAVVSLREARKHLPGRVLMGNVSTFAVELTDPENVDSLTRKCIGSGADIVSPACGLGMGSPLPNVKAILKAVRSESDSAASVQGQK